MARAEEISYDEGQIVHPDQHVRITPAPSLNVIDCHQSRQQLIGRVHVVVAGAEEGSESAIDDVWDVAGCEGVPHLWKHDTLSVTLGRVKGRLRKASRQRCSPWTDDKLSKSIEEGHDPVGVGRGAGDRGENWQETTLKRQKVGGNAVSNCNRKKERRRGGWRLCMALIGIASHTPRWRWTSVRESVDEAIAAEVRLPGKDGRRYAIPGRQSYKVALVSYSFLLSAWKERQTRPIFLQKRHSRLQEMVYVHSSLSRNRVQKDVANKNQSRLITSRLPLAPPGNPFRRRFLLQLTS